MQHRHMANNNNFHNQRCLERSPCQILHDMIIISRNRLCSVNTNSSSSSNYNHKIHEDLCLEQYRYRPLPPTIDTTNSINKYNNPSWLGTIACYSSGIGSRILQLRSSDIWACFKEGTSPLPFPTITCCCSSRRRVD